MPLSALSLAKILSEPLGFSEQARPLRRLIGRILLAPPGAFQRTWNR
jgi:hypothetical protein